MRTRAVIASVALTLVVAAPAYGQIPRQPGEGPQFPVGKFVLYPALSASFEGTDNVFLRSDADPVNVRSTTITTASGGILVELPFSHSHVRAGYGIRYRSYGAEGLNTNTNHYLLAETRLRFGNGFVVEARDDYQRGVLDTEVFDEAAEITFAGERFELNNLAARVGIERDQSRRIYLGLTRDDNQVLGERISNIPDWNRSWLRLDLEEQLSPRTWLLVGVARGDGEYTRFDEFGDEAGFNDLTAWVARAGARVFIGPNSALQFFGGYADYEFRSERDSSFRGGIGTLEYERQLPNRGRLSAAVAREVYPTLADRTSNYLVSQQVRVRVDSATRTKFVLGGSAQLYVNRYPDMAPVREDTITDLQLWGGYRFAEFAECRLTVGRSRRDSEGSLLDYEENRILVEIRFGT